MGEYRPRVEIHAFKSIEGVPHVLASVGRDGLAFPGGGIDRGSATSAAKREMLEEAGYKLRSVKTFESPKTYTMSQKWQAESELKRGRPFVGVRNQIVHAELGDVDKRLHGVEGDAMSGLRLIPVEHAQQLLRRQAMMASYTSGSDGNWEDRAEPALRSLDSAAARYGQMKTAGELTSRGRRQVSEGNFALPGRRYPIHDISHARNALARVAQHGSEAEQRVVQDAVHARYPSIKYARGELSKMSGYTAEQEWERGGHRRLDGDTPKDTLARYRAALRSISPAERGKFAEMWKQRHMSIPTAEWARTEMRELAELERLERSEKTAEVEYRGHTFPGYNQPITAPAGDTHKMMVLAKKGDSVKLVRFGHRGYSHNYSPEAKANYLKRSAGIRDGSGNLTMNDPHSPNYWARKHLWPKNQKADGSALKKEANMNKAKKGGDIDASVRARIALIRASQGGNESVSNMVANVYAEELRRLGHDVDEIDLKDVPYADDWDDKYKNDARKRLAQSHATVFATPVYNWGPSARLNAYVQQAVKSGSDPYRPYGVLGAAGSSRSQGYLHSLQNSLAMEDKGINVGAPIIATEADAIYDGDVVKGIGPAHTKRLQEHAAELGYLAHMRAQRRHHANSGALKKESQASCDRDYRREYLRDHASPEAKRHRAMRNYWNRKIDTKPGQEIDHKVPLSKGGGNGRDNIRVVSREANRRKATKTAALAAIRERIRGPRAL